jgi:hypothetical protein
MEGDALHELFPFKEGKHVLFHETFNENNKDVENVPPLKQKESIFATRVN